MRWAVDRLVHSGAVRRLPPLAVALALLAAALPAQAQADLAQPGLAQPDLPWLEPCLEGHFQPELYRNALADRGWQLMDDDARAGALARLADAFLPLLEGDATDLEARRHEAQVHWAGFSDGRSLMARGDAVLMLAGASTEAGHRAVECWVVLDDPALAEGLIADAEGGAAIDAATPAYAVYGPVALESGAMLMLLAARQTAPPEALLAATHGLLIRTEFSPPH